ncbi:MAG: hypothetical protein KBE23_22565 [Chloroflexi bacterium]|nr:hypothetical protein [Chloroflexota bacterium]MBP7045552.1 hypothetical protein [Chloroflexota bacterium]
MATNLLELLNEQETLILDEAVEALARSQLRHYTAAGAAWNRQRLQNLFNFTRDCVRKRTLMPLVEHMELIAQERFEAGFDIHEVQTAVNVLEESIWQQINHTLPPSEYAEAFGLISTVLGAGKDALAQSYVTLASHTKAPSLNLNALFQGTAG